MPCALLAAALGTAGCVKDVVSWSEETRVGGPPAASARLVLGANGAPAFVAAWTPPTTPGGSTICPGSLAAAPARGDTAFAAWWASRGDSTAVLVAARSNDRGRAWGEAVIADSTDRGRTGCRRAAPFLAVDSLTGNVHLAYFLEAPEGPGVFLTHSMEGGAMFHAPVPVVYGERPSAAAVAARGDTVAVAFTDPNAAAPQLWLAISRSTGHILEQRARVSSPAASASRPAVALRGDRIAVAWYETARGSETGTTVIRTGRLRP
ncbi:MAG TPA: sialidase family protein [Gemmatimonadaceae bacterium]|nr:sialidase family protein [Gemmatimonadaceae bacterium]